MRAIAEFAMRGQPYAIATSMIAASLPLLGWIGTVIVALVCLRHGVAAGSIVLLWTLLPIGITFYFQGDPSSALVLVSSLVLAMLLRQTFSWELVLAGAVVLSAIGALAFEWIAASLHTRIAEIYLEYLAQVQTVQPVLSLTLEEAKTVVLGFLALLLSLLMVVPLIIARWCQSALYNPGGFGKEFRQLRLSPAISGGVVLLMLLCFMWSEQLGLWLPLLTVPLVFASIGLVHWLMTHYGLSNGWVAAFYAALLLLFQLVYPFLASMALMDSWFNIRNRVQTTTKE